MMKRLMVATLTILLLTASVLPINGAAAARLGEDVRIEGFFQMLEMPNRPHMVFYPGEAAGKGSFSVENRDGAVRYVRFQVFHCFSDFPPAFTDPGLPSLPMPPQMELITMVGGQVANKSFLTIEAGKTIVVEVVLKISGNSGFGVMYYPESYIAIDRQPDTPIHLSLPSISVKRPGS